MFKMELIHLIDLYLGEEKFRVFNTGAPLVDELIDDKCIRNIRCKLNINNNKTYTSNTKIILYRKNQTPSGEQMEILFDIEKYDVNKVFYIWQLRCRKLNIRKIILSMISIYSIFYNLKMNRL